MRRSITPTLLRTLLLGSLGLAEQACSSDEPGNTDGRPSMTGGAASTGGAHSNGSGGQLVATGGRSTGGGGQATGGDTPRDGGRDASTGGDGNDAGWTGDDAGLTSAKGCTNPVPLIPGTDTGIYTCSEGYWHRVEAHLCASHLPRDQAITPPTGVTLLTDECTRDSDCAAANSPCILSDGTEYSCGNAPKLYRRICQHGCRVDADCGPAFVCVCGADIGTCIALNDHDGCHSDADCSAGLCLSNANLGAYGPGSFACQSASDECDSRADCVTGYCSMSPTGRTCVAFPACGRPFVIAHAPRLASVVASSAWLGASEVTGIDLPLDPGVARRLAEHWTRIGLMEHASVAAFARFTLQLLALGAPLELVQRSTEAQADETRHASLAFQMASLYGAAAVGPAPLDLRGALDDLSLASVLRTTIAEGCIGETRAALEASEAGRVATVPGVKSALERIAADESEHAALAWRVVRWILDEHPELASVARAEFARGPSPAPVTHSEPGPALLLAHGLLDAAALGRIHACAEQDVIAPCARALLAD